MGEPVRRGEEESPCLCSACFSVSFIPIHFRETSVFRFFSPILKSIWTLSCQEFLVIYLCHRRESLMKSQYKLVSSYVLGRINFIKWELIMEVSSFVYLGCASSEHFSLMAWSLDIANKNKCNQCINISQCEGKVRGVVKGIDFPCSIVGFWQGQLASPGDFSLSPHTDSQSTLCSWRIYLFSQRCFLTGDMK